MRRRRQPRSVSTSLLPPLDASPSGPAVTYPRYCRRVNSAGPRRPEPAGAEGPGALPTSRSITADGSLAPALGRKQELRSGLALDANLDACHAERQELELPRHPL